MDRIKPFFPYSFGVKDLTDLVVKIIVYLVVGAVAGVAIAILGHLPLIGWIIKAFGGLIDLYVFLGIVLAVLDYFKVLR